MKNIANRNLNNQFVKRKINTTYGGGVKLSFDSKTFVRLLNFRLVNGAGYLGIFDFRVACLLVKGGGILLFLNILRKTKKHIIFPSLCLILCLISTRQVASRERFGCPVRLLLKAESRRVANLWVAE